MIKRYDFKAVPTADFIPDLGPVVSEGVCVEYCRKFYADDMLIYESAYALYLNRANMPMAWAKLGQGGIHAAIVDVRLLVKYALDVMASAVILVHNHPSGTLKPSPHDDKLTKQVKGALEIFDIQLLDHIILTPKGSFSYSNECRL